MTSPSFSTSTTCEEIGRQEELRRPLWESLGPASNDFIQERVPMNLLIPITRAGGEGDDNDLRCESARVEAPLGAAASEPKKVPLPKEALDKAQADAEGEGTDDGSSRRRRRSAGVEQPA